MNTLKRTREMIVPILKKHDVVRAGVFGSFARREATKKSDIDIVIQFRGRKSLLDLASLELELEKNLKRKVDLLTYNSLHPLLKDKVGRDEVKVL